MGSGEQEFLINLILITFGASQILPLYLLWKNVQWARITWALSKSIIGTQNMCSQVLDYLKDKEEKEEDS